MSSSTFQTALSDAGDATSYISIHLWEEGFTFCEGIVMPLYLIHGDGNHCLLGRYPLSVLEDPSYKLCQLLLIHGVTPLPCHSYLSSLILNSSCLSYSSNFSQSSVSVWILCNQIFTLFQNNLSERQIWVFTPPVARPTMAPTAFSACPKHGGLATWSPM